MFLAIVIAVVLVFLGIVAYQWVRPPGGKPIDNYRQPTHDEAVAQVGQTGRNSQYLIPPS